MTRYTDAPMGQRPRWNFLDAVFIGGGTTLCLLLSAVQGWESGISVWLLTFAAYCFGRTVTNTR